MSKQRILQIASGLTLLVTLVLFILAAFVHGLSSELLLEAGVFLISVKLVLSTQKSEILISQLQAQLDEINKKLDR